MIRTKNVITGIVDIPREWIFEYYLTLPEMLNGQNVKIKSPFNVSEKNPSFFVYFCKTSHYYKFKDFSTGESGDAVELVKLLRNCKTRSGATKQIIKDYKIHLSNTNGKVKRESYIPQEQYKVIDFTPRNWNEIDKHFWTPFGITSAILRKYKVQPLKSYTIEKKLPDGKKSTIVLDKALMYGYFTEKGKLYKIYQPYVKNTKFFKVLDYVQGTDQLSKTKPNLVICSSLKDIMGMEALKFKSVDMVAPNSENTLIDEYKDISIYVPYLTMIKQVLNQWRIIKISMVLIPHI
jgi:hypothetical protein